MKQPNWTRILTILLVILAAFAVLYVLGIILGRFRQALVLFIIGAIVAYLLNPLVDRLQAAFRLRWLAVLLSYGLLAAGLLGLSIMLFTPFIQQVQSLVDNLHNPASGSLRTIVQVERDVARVRQELRIQAASIRVTGLIPQHLIDTTNSDIARLQHDIDDVRNGTISGKSHTVVHGKEPPGRVPPNPEPQTRVPQSYVKLIMTPAAQLAAAYEVATSSSTSVDTASFNQAKQDAKAAGAAARRVYHTISTTPILVVRSQTWLDDHKIHVDLLSRVGQAAAKVSSQGTIILDNAITILSETANVLLNITLILIIAFYLLLDGGRLVHSGMRVVPTAYRDQAWFFVGSLDRVLGGYLRGQFLLSLIAGIMGGGGAAALGVPYPLLIGIVTFLLESVPVIGPMVAIVPPVAISLFFMPVVTTVLLAIWFIVFQQIVTNVLGPRVMSMAVGIHPLEALLAVLVGYPLGGFLGAFLAVPVMGIIHILIRETYGNLVLGRKVSTEAAPGSVDISEGSDVPPAPTPLPARPKADRAAQ